MKDMNYKKEKKLVRNDAVINKAEEFIESGKVKIEYVRERLPDGFEQKVGELANWTKANPYKATSLGLLGILSIKSKLARSVGMLIVSSVGTNYLKREVEKNQKRNTIYLV